MIDSLTAAAQLLHDLRLESPVAVPVKIHPADAAFQIDEHVDLQRGGAGAVPKNLDVLLQRQGEEGMLTAHTLQLALGEALAFQHIDQRVFHFDLPFCPAIIRPGGAVPGDGPWAVSAFKRFLT